MLKELIEKREKLVADARSALEEIKKNTDEARAAELEKRHDDIMAEFDKVDAQLVREKRQMEAQKRIEDAAAEERAKNRPIPGDGEGRGVDGGDKALEYREVFAKAIRFGAATLDAEERAILMTGRADVPQELRAQSVGTDKAVKHLIMAAS